MKNRVDDFYKLLISEVLLNLENQYTDNLDIYRFGVRASTKKRWREIVKTFFKDKLKIKEQIVDSSFYSCNLKRILPYLDSLAHFYTILSDVQSKELLVKLVTYKILGEFKYKLPLSTPEYWQGIEKIIELRKSEDYISVRFVEGANINLYKFDLNKLSIPIQIYYKEDGIYSHLAIKQYEYQSPDLIIKIEEGDIVLDCGGCWGDTALFFANEVGKNGHVYTFEFIPSNIKVFETNLSLNPELERRITLVPRPLGKVSGDELCYIDNGPASRVSSEDISLNKVVTISIDDFVLQYDVNQVDFIKMDIEGAEPSALEGAVNTIKSFKPKLAISIYHSMNDFVNIVQYIDSLNLGYKFYLKHGTIHEEETVLIAIVPKI